MMSYVGKHGSKISEGLYTVFPRIIAAPRLIASPPSFLAIFSSFNPLLVKVKCNVIQQNRSVIQAMKINQGTRTAHVQFI